MGLNDVAREIGNLGTVALLIGITVVLLTVFALIAEEIQEGEEISNILTTVNESVTLADSSAILAAGPPRETNSIVTNQTNATISNNNYDIFQNGSIIFFPGATNNGTANFGGLGESGLINVTYERDLGQTYTKAGNVSQEGQQTAQNIVENMPLLGTVVILGLVVMVILAAFTFRKREGGF